MDGPEYWGVAGNPIKHSLTPKIFDIVGKYLGIDAPQILFLEVDNYDEFRKHIDDLEGEIWLSITYPLKHKICKIIDNEYDIKVGSINQIIRNNDKFYGINSDGDGFLEAVKYYGIEPLESILKIKGGGSTARSIAKSWSEHGGKIIKENGRRNLKNGPWDKSIIKEQNGNYKIDLDVYPGDETPKSHEMILPLTYNQHSTKDDFGLIMLVSQHLNAWRNLFLQHEELELPTIKYVLDCLFDT